MTTPRIRFAPSPTGHLHVGNARTALFNWLLARRHSGPFILRIEDTDTERSTRASEDRIKADLRWLGLDWDEGPDVGGPHGPYRQSERGTRYRAAADALRAAGSAYYCFCTTEVLEAERASALAAGQPPRYSGRCRSLDPGEASARVAQGVPAAVRFAVPAGDDVTFRDLVRGDVTFRRDVIGDPVMLRSDGTPAYNFAVVVDDAEMEITHVVRGEDHISNTPRQILMYEALGRIPPAFAHLSLVLGPDHAPLSKRHGATSVAEFRDRGYLPEALVNYLALLGWSPGENEEIVSIDEMVRRFDLSRVAHSAAVFDVDKLAWINRQYMKALPAPRVAREALPYFERAGLLTGSDRAAPFVESLLPMVVGSVDRLEDIPARLDGLFRWDAETAARLIAAEPDAASAIRVVQALAGELEGRTLPDRDAFRAAADRVRRATGVKGRELFHPIRVALTAAAAGPELDLIVPCIERAASLPASVVRSAIPPCHERASAVALRLTAMAAADGGSGGS